MVGITRKDTPAATPDGPSIQQRLSTARATAQTARAHLDGLNSRLHQAVEEARYGDADALQAEIPEAEHANTIASAELRAIEFAIEELNRERAERDAKIQAEKKKQAAQGNLARAAEAERAGMDALAAVKAEILAGLGAIKDAVARGQAIEGQVRQARADQAQARVDSGEATGLPGHIAAPNMVTSLVDQTPALRALIRNQLAGY